MAAKKKTSARRPRAAVNLKSQISNLKSPARPAAAQARRPARVSVEHRKLWLMYPPRLIQTPLIWELSGKFGLVTNVRQASVNDEIGIVCLELSGKREDIKTAIKWLEKKGVKVEPVEIGVIAG